MKCPLCGLFNPIEAQRCDCGYVFGDKAIGGQQLERTGRFNMVVGAISFVGGLIVSGVSLAVAMSLKESGAGCVVVIAWGAILFGAIQFFRGWGQYSRRRKI